MEKHISKKLFAGILALSAGFILASCDPVSAVPQNYNNPIIASTDGEIVLDGNNLGTLYDSITSERNSKIVDDILSQIAEKKFGSYAEFLDACSSTEKQVAFVKAHEDFFGTDENKDARFTAFMNDLEERISEYFYNEITSGSYNDDLGRFSEKKLYNAHKYELYDLGEEPATFKTFFVDKELTKENAFSKLNGDVYKVAEAGKRGYIQEKVYPDILRNKLVEDYIYKNNPSSLGRAYARELSYVKISYEGESKFADSLMENFAKTEIQDTHADREHIDFSIIENAYKGFLPSDTQNPLITPVSGDAKTLLDAVVTSADDKIVVDYTDPNFDEEDYKTNNIVLIPEGTYYKDTKIGEILEDYQKAVKAEAQGRFPTSENKEALDSFTADGKSKQYGLLQKLISLMKEDYTTDGWYVKNGGVTELPSAIRDRLFNIRVANSLDDGSLINENGTDHQLGDYQYVDGDPAKDKLTRLPYLRNIYGKKVVLPSKSLSFDKDPFNYVYHDVDAKAFYVCEVLEAPSTAKLNETSQVYSALDKENISRQVAKILGTKDSYIKDAYTEYLNKYVFTFYDTSLYDYFKSEYPDLDQFDD